MTSRRISNLDLTQNADPLVDQNSADAYYMNSKAVRYKPTDTAAFDGGLLGSGGSGGDDPKPKPHDIPELSDIEYVTKTVYTDTKTNESKAKLVIRIRNNSGKTLSGIDARIAIPTGSGGK